VKEQAPPKKAGAGGPNWRLGKFHDDNDEDQYLTEQQSIESQSMAAGIKVEEKQLSKHQARRMKKKQKKDEEKKGPIMGDDEPTLDDLL